jgi:hypothetical protein
MNMKSKTRSKAHMNVADVTIDRVIVVCDIHGPMKHRFQLDWWECLGFDGTDYCSTLVRAETLARSAMEVGRHRESDFYPGEDKTIPKPTWHLEIRWKITEEEDEWM